ncbi:helicase HerA domain-containing protein, partial [Faecalitalea cylindroides]|uniref:helicase HerA domain-containing protein n=1 Tax=Faecalitalea cylindroides TaxID=39483 RepID=UPI00189AB340
SVYLGVRNNENNNEIKRSTVTLGDTLKNTLIGNFPGVKIEVENRKRILDLCNNISKQNNVTSVSVVANQKNSEQNNEQFVQGLEKLALAMNGRQYTGIIIAENQDSQTILEQRKFYQNLYTQLSPLQKEQFSNSQSIGINKSKSFFEMDAKQKSAMLGGVGVSLAGIIGGAFLGGNNAFSAAMVGGQIAGQLNGFIQSLAPSEQYSKSSSRTLTTTTENKSVTDLLKLLDEAIKRTNEFDSYGMWNVAGYFISDDMSTAEIAASNYRSLMNGENSGREVSAINSWRRNGIVNGDFSDLTTYLSRFVHPQFCYWGNNGLITASTFISGKELGLHLGLPRATIPGLPVIEHAEFGKEVVTYRLFSKERNLRPEDRITLGKVFDLGQIIDKEVELDNKSLNMHTFITGSTGSGKSNTVYQMLTELHQDKIPFLVVEPAKG